MNHTFDTVTIEACADMRWLVVKTRPRCEKKLAAYCFRRHVTTFLPLRRSIRHYPHRTVEFLIPMFAGYVFAQIDPGQTLTIMESRQAADVIVPDATMESHLITELNDLQFLIHATDEGTLEIRPEIQPGHPVTITGGALAGMSGIVTRRNNRTRVTVNVEMIGHSVSIDLDVGEIEVDH